MTAQATRNKHLPDANGWCLGCWKEEFTHIAWPCHRYVWASKELSDDLGFVRLNRKDQP